MFSIHDRKLSRRCARMMLVAAGGAVSLMFASGCSQTPPLHVAKLDDTPLIIDQATQQRDWDRSVAYYPNGSVPAWSTRFWYHPNPKTPQWIKPVSEPVAFVGQTVFLPVAFVMAPPKTAVIYHGEIVPATSTAFPAFPDTDVVEQQH